VTRERVRSPIHLHRKAIELTLRHPWTIARGTSAVRHNVLTRIEHGGFEGYGEAAPNARYAEDAGTVLKALDELAPLLGDDPARHEAIIDRLAAALPDSGAARASIDIALHDWIGRQRGLPLYRLFGADPSRAPLTSMSIGIDTIATMQDRARQAVEFKILKTKRGPGNDRETLEGIRDVTDIP